MHLGIPDLTPKTLQSWLCHILISYFRNEADISMGGISFSHRSASLEALQNERAAYLAPLGSGGSGEHLGSLLILRLGEEMEHPGRVRLWIPFDFSK